MRKQYGLPYRGSKTKIAEDIINIIPKKNIFVDLFGGGGAISICASQSQNFEKIIYNELNALVFQTFQKALNGEYENDRRWISREDFFKLKDTDGYVQLCYSFNGSASSYIYNKEIEPYKKAYHYVVCFNDFSFFNELFDDETTEKVKKSLEGISTIRDRRIKLSKEIGNYISARQTHLEKIERLELIKRTIHKSRYETTKVGRDALSHYIKDDFQGQKDRFSAFSHIELLNKDYQDVELPAPEDCVIYCDIPYKDTWGYNNLFDHDAFYKWCQEKTSEGYEIYVSSYELPEEIFEQIWQKQRFSSPGRVKLKVIEKLYKVKVK